jgi:hypothetical protein
MLNGGADYEIDREYGISEGPLGFAGNRDRGLPVCTRRSGGGTKKLLR